MESLTQKKIAVVTLGLVLVIALLGWRWQVRQEKTSDASLPTPAASDMQDEGKGTGLADEDGVVVEEQRPVDIDAVVSEIESSDDGDASVLDEEYADESLSVREGQLVIEEMGQSYDETSY